MYNTCGDYGEMRDRERFLRDPADLARELRREGIRTMKIWPFDEYAERIRGHDITAAQLHEGVSALAAIRESLGEEMQVAIEGRCLGNLPTAVRIAHALEPHRPAWLEDLTWAEGIETLRDLRRSTSIPIVASERLTTRWRFFDLIGANAADIVMFDLVWTSGFSERERSRTWRRSVGSQSLPTTAAARSRTSRSRTCTRKWRTGS